MSKEQQAKEQQPKKQNDDLLSQFVSKLSAWAENRGGRACAEGSVNNSCKDGKATLRIAVQGRYCLTVTVTDAEVCGGVTVSGVPGVPDESIGSGNSGSYSFFVVKIPTTITLKCTGTSELSNSCRFSYRLVRG